MDSAFAVALTGFWRGWNAGDTSLTRLPSLPEWQRHCEEWRGRLLGQVDLTRQMLGFVSETL
jgi:hypothetical protein